MTFFATFGWSYVPSSQQELSDAIVVVIPRLVATIGAIHTGTSQRQSQSQSQPSHRRKERTTRVELET
jgi:hypothetical protein